MEGGGVLENFAGGNGGIGHEVDVDAFEGGELECDHFFLIIESFDAGTDK